MGVITPKAVLSSAREAAQLSDSVRHNRARRPIYVMPKRSVERVEFAVASDYYVIEPPAATLAPKLNPFLRVLP